MEEFCPTTQLMDIEKVGILDFQKSLVYIAQSIADNAQKIDEPSGAAAKGFLEYLVTDELELRVFGRYGSSGTWFLIKQCHFTNYRSRPEYSQAESCLAILEIDLQLTRAKNVHPFSCIATIEKDFPFPEASDLLHHKFCDSIRCRLWGYRPSSRRLEPIPSLMFVVILPILGKESRA